MMPENHFSEGDVTWKLKEYRRVEPEFESSERRKPQPSTAEHYYFELILSTVRLGVCANRLPQPCRAVSAAGWML